VPAKSKAKQRLLGADLARARAGKRTRTGMSEAQLREMAEAPEGPSLPERVAPTRKGKKGR